MRTSKNYNLLLEKKYNQTLKHKYLKTKKYIIMRNLLSISCLVVLLSLFGCKEKTITDTTKKPFCLTDSLKKKIVVDGLKKQFISEHFTLTGNVSYNPDKTVHFISLVDGVITTIHFTLGDYVKKGQILAEIKSVELNELDSERKTLESQLLVSNRQFAATKSMYEDGIASQKDLIEAESNVNVLKATLQNKIENLSLYSASNQKGIFQIKAPNSGYIVAKNISSGTQISAGSDPLFTISGLNEVWVMVNIYATNMQNVKKNMEVDIKTLAYTNEIFKGKISALSQVFDEEERVLKARIVMENKDLKLKPGMSADIIIKKQNQKQQQAIAIPAKSVIFDNNQNIVLVYKSDCKIEIRKINIIAQNENWIYVDENFVEDETVISKNHLLIYEQIRNAQ